MPPRAEGTATATKPIDTVEGREFQMTPVWWLAQMASQALMFAGLPLVLCRL